MSAAGGSRSGYTIEVLNEDGIWKKIFINYECNEKLIKSAYWPHDACINMMAGVLSYEAAVAILASYIAESFENSLRQYRLRRHDVTYDIRATETDDTAMYVRNMFSANLPKKTDEAV